jgi:hypothetical protein
MEILERAKELWGAFYDIAEPVFYSVRRFLQATVSYIVKLRKILLSIPVAWAAVWLALRNFRELPQYLDLNILPGYDQVQMITREIAVLGPLAVTAACLLMVMISRREIYPWLISVFSLALPVLLIVITMFQ